MQRPIIFLRREPTTDPQIVRMASKPRKWPLLDVCAYGDREATDRRARWGWYHRGKPDRRYKVVTLNCAAYSVEWLPDLEPPA